jgi:hypothetical protein
MGVRMLHLLHAVQHQPLRYVPIFRGEWSNLTVVHSARIVPLLRLDHPVDRITRALNAVVACQLSSEPFRRQAPTRVKRFILVLNLKASNVDSSKWVGCPLKCSRWQELI